MVSFFFFFLFFQTTTALTKEDTGAFLLRSTLVSNLAQNGSHRLYWNHVLEMLDLAGKLFFITGAGVASAAALFSEKLYLFSYKPEFGQELYDSKTKRTSLLSWELTGC